MLYTTTQRENPLDRSQKKFYAAPSYTEDVALRKVAQDISKTCTLTPKMRYLVNTKILQV